MRACVRVFTARLSMPVTVIAAPFVTTPVIAAPITVVAAPVVAAHVATVPVVAVPIVAASVITTPVTVILPHARHRCARHSHRRCTCGQCTHRRGACPVRVNCLSGSDTFSYISACCCAHCRHVHHYDARPGFCCARHHRAPVVTASVTAAPVIAMPFVAVPVITMPITVVAALTLSITTPVVAAPVTAVATPFIQSQWSRCSSLGVGWALLCCV